jgi:hypothetical protein
MWRFVQQMHALESRIGKLGALTTMIVLSGFVAIVPFFRFALYRNEGDLKVPGSVKWVAITAAAVMGILTVASIPKWLGSVRY